MLNSAKLSVYASSLRLKCRGPLIVVIFNASFMFVPLLLLSRPSTIGNISELAFVLAIGEDLLTAQVLLLLGPQAISILLMFAGHLSFTHLHLAFIHNSRHLLLVHAFEVVGLNTMRC